MAHAAVTVGVLMAAIFALRAARIEKREVFDCPLFGGVFVAVFILNMHWPYGP